MTYIRYDVSDYHVFVCVVWDNHNNKLGVSETRHR